MKYPTWFPYPTSWLKALLLLLLFEVIDWLSKQGGSDFTSPPIETAPLGDSPEIYILIAILTLLSPIALIAITHYLIHLVLGQFAPSLQSPQVKWNLPLMSLWEGVWGWTVIMIALLVLGAVLCIVPGLAEEAIENHQAAKNFLRAIWLTASAYLYHIEYLVQNWFTANPQPSNRASLDPSQSITKDLNRLRGKMGLTQMRSRKPDIKG